MKPVKVPRLSSSEGDDATFGRDLRVRCGDCQRYGCKVRGPREIRLHCGEFKARR